MARRVARCTLDLHIMTLLRALVPYRKLGHEEALFYAEQQATVFLKLGHLIGPPMPIEKLVTEVGIAGKIVDDPAQRPLGKSTLDGATGEWVITLNTRAAEDDRPFVVAHEVKHILDYEFGDLLYPPIEVMPTDRRKEDAANYFAFCLITPRRWVEREWKRGVRDPEELARIFGTSRQTMQFRLAAMGLLGVDADGTGLVDVRD